MNHGRNKKWKITKYKIAKIQNFKNFRIPIKFFFPFLCFVFCVFNIPSLPEQYRWGVNRLSELLDPLVKKGLKSVLIFGVLTNENDPDAANQNKESTGKVYFLT